MVRNMSLCTNGGLRVVSSGSSELNPYENKIIEGDIPAKYGQLSPICDSSSMDVSNEHISTASVDRTVETQPALFLETNHTNVERRNTLNGMSVQHTSDGDAESSPSYNTQVPSEGSGYDRQIENRNYKRPRIMFAVYYG